MLVEDGLNFLTQLDLDGFVVMFWYVLVLEIPRFTLGLIVVSGCSLLRPWHSAGLRPEHVKLSVLFPGHNEAAGLRRAIAALGEQSWTGFQIVVVDDGSTDNMADIGRRLRAEGLVDVFVSTGLRGGKSAATNLGLGLCTGDIVVVGDVDTSFDRYAIERVIEPFCDPLVGCVAGNVGVRNYRGPLIARFQAIEYLISIALGRRLSDLLGILMISSGAFAAFRHQALIDVGGWDVGPGEDANITLKLRSAGWKIRFAPDAWALTDVPETVSAFFKQRRRWNASFVAVRLIRFRSVLNPFRQDFSAFTALGTIDLILFHALLPAMFLVYVVCSISYYGPLFWAILAAINIFYILTTMFVFLCAVAVSGHYGHISLAPYVIGYALFRAVMRIVNFWNYIDEFLLRRSYQDPFVPSRVQKKKPW